MQIDDELIVYSSAIKELSLAAVEHSGAEKQLRNARRTPVFPP